MALREALRELLLAQHEGHDAHPSAVPTMEEAARRARLEVRFGPDGIAAVAPPPTASMQRSAVFSIVADAQAEGTWSRMKACPLGDLPLGLLRPLQEPLGRVVRHGRVRQPREGSGIPRAPDAQSPDHVKAV
jgi:hypothetical protein